MEEIVKDYKHNVLASFESYKRLAERALEQIDDEQFFLDIDPESNSVAVIIKHITGNQRSRFTDFLTTDGEKPDRNRDSEFTDWEADRDSLMERWEESWRIVLDAVESLELKDFGKTVTIRGEDHTVVEAINRQLTHYAYHIGQITFLAKHLRSGSWQSLSVPKGASQQFNDFLKERKDSGKEQLSPLDGPAEFSKQ